MDGKLLKSDKKDPFRVGLLPVPGFALLSYACTVEPLRAANLLSQRDLFEVVHFAESEVARSSGAARVEARLRTGQVPDVDLLVVVAGGRPETHEDPDLFRWLRQAAARGIPLAGVSGGPVLLARAGVMEGYRMTVHWEHAPAMAEIVPGQLIERSLYVIDRDRLTCGGGTAPLDLMHELIAMQHGAGFARQVSDWFLHTDIRPSGGPQRAGLSERIGSTSPRVLEAVNAIHNHIADPLTLAQLSMIAGITPRQLNRLFRDDLGQSTMQYYRSMRLDIAQQLVRGSGLSMTEIALATGFAGSAHFSSAYRAAYGTAPSAARSGETDGAARLHGKA